MNWRALYAALIAIVHVVPYVWWREIAYDYVQ